MFACELLLVFLTLFLGALPFGATADAADLLIADVQFSGVTVFDDRAIRRIAALRAGDPASEAAIKNAIVRLQKEYSREGYPFSEIQAEVHQRENTPHGIVDLTVDEGPLVRISRIEVLGEFPPDIEFLRKELESRAAGAAASLRNRRTLRLELLAALRREGYLQASVDLEEFQFHSGETSVVLRVRVEPHDPITLLFEGNTALSAEELLRPMKFETRTVPFSPSALKQLLSESVSLYQSEGYYFATARLEDLGLQGVRQVYRVIIQEGPRVHLEHLDIVGNNAFSKGQLFELVQLETQGPWIVRGLFPGYVQQATLDGDVFRISEFYREAAFDDVAVKAEVVPDGNNGLNVTYKIEEGERSTIDQAVVQWQKGQPEEVSPNEVSEILDPILHQPAEPGKIEELRTKLETLLELKGFEGFQVRGEYQRDSKLLTFRIQAGEHLEVANVSIQGLVYTKESVVRDALDLRRGMIIRGRDLRRAEQALYRLGVFHRVNVELLQSKEGPQMRDIVIDVFERDSGTLDLGTTFDSEDGIQLIGEIGQRNLAGSGNSLIFNVNGSQRSGNKILDAGTARALFLVPQYEGPDFLAEAYSQYSIQLFNPFSFDKEGFSFSLRSPQERQLRGVLRWIPYQERVYDVADDVVLGPRDTGSTFYSFLRGEGEWDKRDDPANPNKGFRIRAETQATSRRIGADVSLASLRTSESYYIPLSSRLIWSHRSVQSAVRPFDGTDVVPLSQRIFLGGRDSLRGFSRYSVSPRGVQGDVVGGDTSIEYSSEFQYAFTENIRGAIFLDTGVSVLKQPGSFTGDALTLSWRDLRYSPGFGVRYKTPIGPIRLEFGFALDRQFGERPARVILAVGNPF